LALVIFQVESPVFAQGWHQAILLPIASHVGGITCGCHHNPIRALFLGVFLGGGVLVFAFSSLLIYLFLSIKLICSAQFIRTLIIFYEIKCYKILELKIKPIKIFKLL
jgi:hypothetical protein